MQYALPCRKRYRFTRRLAREAGGSVQRACTCPVARCRESVRETMPEKTFRLYIDQASTRTALRFRNNTGKKPSGYTPAVYGYVKSVLYLREIRA
jgi:hypothetical protein